MKISVFVYLNLNFVKKKNKKQLQIIQLLSMMINDQNQLIEIKIEKFIFSIIIYEGQDTSSSCHRYLFDCHLFQRTVCVCVYVCADSIIKIYISSSHLDTIITHTHTYITNVYVRSIRMDSWVTQSNYLSRRKQKISIGPYCYCIKSTIKVSMMIMMMMIANFQ